jgi:hypothetical protein
VTTLKLKKPRTVFSKKIPGAKKPRQSKRTKDFARFWTAAVLRLFRKKRANHHHNPERVPQKNPVRIFFGNKMFEYGFANAATL